MSRSFSLANTCRKLRLSASADGHDLESNILRTARLLALLRDLVSDRTLLPDWLGAASASGAAGTALASGSAVAPLPLLPVLLLLAAPYDRESDTSDGAMQKSISFTLPLLWNGMLPSVAADVVDSSSTAVGWARRAGEGRDDDAMWWVERDDDKKASDQPTTNRAVTMAIHFSGILIAVFRLSGASSWYDGRYRYSKSRVLPRGEYE